MKGPPLSLSRSLLAYLPPSATSSSSPLISGPPIPFPPIALLVYLPRPSTPPTQTFPLPPPPLPRLAYLRLEAHVQHPVRLVEHLPQITCADKFVSTRAFTTISCSGIDSV